MKVKIRTESFDPTCPTNEEIEIMENMLYSDIPLDKRSEYSKNERKWLSNHKTHDKMSGCFPSSNLMMPVGINSNTAFGINVEQEVLLKVIEGEKNLFFKAWKANILRSTNKDQFDYRIKKFMVGDPNFEEITKRIETDEEIKKFGEGLGGAAAQSLPEEGGIGAEGLEPGAEGPRFQPREDSPIQTISIDDVEKPSIIKGDKIYILYYNNYNTKGSWKPSKITCKTEFTPSISICEKYILVAYYVNDATVIVKLFDMQFKKKTEWFCNMRGPLKTAVNSFGWMVVSDGIMAYQKRDGFTYQHIIQNQIITSIHIAESDNYLFLGTYNGQIYDINLKEIRSYSKTLDCTPVLSITTSGDKILAQTISNIITSDSKVFNDVRPLTSTVKGTFVIFLSKYGKVKICSRIHDKELIEYKPPENVQIYINHMLPWYSNGIFFDGKKLAILYPNGMVVSKILE